MEADRNPGRRTHQTGACGPERQTAGCEGWEGCGDRFTVGPDAAVAPGPNGEGQKIRRRWAWWWKLWRPRRG